MKILVGKTFGIGNSILSIPMIKALTTLGEVDILVGSTADDFGAETVFTELKRQLGEKIGKIFRNYVPGDQQPHDVAVMAIPFDGRWQNKVHFNAKRVIDGRKRPGNIERLGFDMWEKHEVLYQMENAYELGYSGPVPNASFLPSRVQDPDLVYLGLGYKRDPGGFGLSKHFGNERFAELIDAIRKLRPATRFVSTGGPTDMIQVAYQIHKIRGHVDNSFRFYPLDLKQSFDVLAGCSAYIGNDTGMMHVAASLPIPTHGLFLSQDLARKNHPYGPDSDHWMISSLDADVDEIANYFVRMVWG